MQNALKLNKEKGLQRIRDLVGKNDNNIRLEEEEYHDGDPYTVNKIANANYTRHPLSNDYDYASPIASVADRTGSESFNANE